MQEPAYVLMDNTIFEGSNAHIFKTKHKWFEKQYVENENQGDGLRFHLSNKYSEALAAAK